MSIKLICSDIDGTLLQYGKKELEDEIFEQIRELHRRGILFCPASGRQYTSLRKLFAPVADCCVFLCENAQKFWENRSVRMQKTRKLSSAVLQQRTINVAANQFD